MSEANKMRVYELAKEMGYSSKEFLDMLRDIGVDARSNFTVLEDPTVKRIREQIKPQKPAGKGKKAVAGAAEAVEPEFRQPQMPEFPPGPRPERRAFRVGETEPLPSGPAPPPPPSPAPAKTPAVAPRKPRAKAVAPRGKKAEAKKTAAEDGKRTCSATTKAGTPCKNAAKPKSRFCARHSE